MYLKKKHFLISLYLLILKLKEYSTRSLVKMDLPLAFFIIIFYCRIIKSVGDTDKKIHKTTADDLCIRSFDPFDYKIPLSDLKYGKIYFTKTHFGSCVKKNSKISINLEKRNSEIDSKLIFQKEKKNDYLFVMKNIFSNKNQNDSSSIKNTTQKTLEIYECDKELDVCNFLGNGGLYNEGEYEILGITGFCATICVELGIEQMKSFGNCNLFGDLILDNFQNYKSCSIPHRNDNGAFKKIQDFFLLNNDLENFLIIILVNSAVTQIILFGIFLCIFYRRFSRLSSLLKNETSKYQFQNENRIDVKDLYSARFPVPTPTYNERTESNTALYSAIDKRKKIKNSFRNIEGLSGYEEGLSNVAMTTNSFTDHDVRMKKEYLASEERKGSVKNYHSLKVPTPPSLKNSTISVAAATVNATATATVSPSPVPASAAGIYASLPPPPPHVYPSRPLYAFEENENDYSEIFNQPVSDNEESSDNISLASSFKYERNFDKEPDFSATATKSLKHQKNGTEFSSSAPVVTSVAIVAEARKNINKINRSPLTRKRIKLQNRKRTLTPPKSNSIATTTTTNNNNMKIYNGV